MGDLIQETPTPSASKRKSRWDETPQTQPPTPSNLTPGTAMGGMTPSTPITPHPGATPVLTPSAITPSGITPTGHKAMALATPTPGHLMSMTPEQLQAYRWEREIDERNRPLTDEELDALFPPGYKVLQPPAGNILFLIYFFFLQISIIFSLFVTYMRVGMVKILNRFFFCSSIYQFFSIFKFYY